METPKHNIESDRELEACENKIAEILSDAIFEHIKKQSQKPAQNVHSLPMSGSKEAGNPVSKNTK